MTLCHPGHISEKIRKQLNNFAPFLGLLNRHKWIGIES